MSKKYQERLAQSSGVHSSKPFESDFGRRVLMKYGWQDGQGLGRLKDGRTDCIQADRRDAKQGLGTEKRKIGDDWDNWWAGCYNDVAGKIQIMSCDSGVSTSVGESDDSDSSDEQDESTKAVGRKAVCMTGKLRRIQRSDNTGS
uniref:G-patch domain-containing protein n=1 Tax=Noctiluca scintillans TaxID=2966 RepID=A0A7S1AU79_NOCSC|mmetsp:Transcript_59714/g.158928  ORF Transcript_59714/g.158928 Transcript_59714/m.158928 type:complete len:144 (+) Transcript_59714:122-553(+)